MFEYTTPLPLSIILEFSDSLKFDLKLKHFRPNIYFRKDEVDILFLNPPIKYIKILDIIYKTNMRGL